MIFGLSDPLHPAKNDVLISRRNLKKIAIDVDSSKSIKLHEDLIDTLNNDINKLSIKL